MSIKHASRAEKKEEREAQFSTPATDMSLECQMLFLAQEADRLPLLLCLINLPPKKTLIH